jgi:predicted ATPase
MKITGNRDGVNNRNETYKIPRIGKVVPRKKAISLFKQGKLDKYGVTKITVNGQEYLKDIPDSSKKDNVNTK